jgi:hypothetical protein
MSEQQSVISSVAPGDSVSSNGKSRKLGKRERLAKRELMGPPPGEKASASKARAFASGPSDPVPTPGRYPVVFQVGVGEPTRDIEFVVDPKPLTSVIGELPDRYSYNPKYVEFLANAGLDDTNFADDVSVAFFLRLAQQLVHSHVNMSLPQGDFSAVASTDVRVPAAMAAVIQQYGEYSVPSLGTRFLLRDYASQVQHAVHTAASIANRGERSVEEVVQSSWLPLSRRDKVTQTIVAAALASFVKPSGVRFDVGILENAVLSGEIPDAWEAVKQFLGDVPDEGGVDRRDRFDFVFRSVTTPALFFTGWSAHAAELAELGILWRGPSAGHMDWAFNAKTEFTTLSDNWARKSAAYAQFFELSSGIANRSAACGSSAQLAKVEDLGGVVVVSTHIALAAPEFSLVSCFPVSSVCLSTLQRNVVVTTSVSVSQRATEFVQLDWR